MKSLSQHNDMLKEELKIKVEIEQDLASERDELQE
jgi:hypothetical protein